MILFYGQNWLLMVALTTAFFSCCPLDHIVTFWIKPYPTSTFEPSSFKINPFATPQHLASLIESSKIWPTAGIIALYGGYIAVSDLSGQVTFPLMQQQPKFFLIVTQHMRPIFMLGNTIHHWELLEGKPVHCFTVSGQQDAKTKLYFWNVEESTAPENLIIPLNAIILFVNPDAIVVPLGASLRNNQPQLILPPVYLLNQPDLVGPAITTLKVKSFFRSIKTTTKKQKENYYARQININSKTP